MSLLADAIFVAMTKAAPPGKSVFSVERVPESVCATTAPTCPGAKRSSFYGGWVRQESREHAEARYRGVAEALALEVAGAADPVAEAGLVVGIAVNESGLREDIQFGRGRSLVRVSRRGRLTRVRDNGDDAGGQGRGPSGEVCDLRDLKRYPRKEDLARLEHLIKAKRAEREGGAF